jgi:hypothetical protein
MALCVNLLHEEILEQRQRQRDPLKIGVMILVGFGVLMFLYYMWSAYRTLEIRGRLSSVQKEWSSLEPKAAKAKKRAEELNGTINTTRVLDDRINNRFFWAPLLSRVAQCVAPNAQLTSFEGVIDEKQNIIVTIEGVDGAREPRAAAEDLRQLLLEQLGKVYDDVTIQFTALEDLDTTVDINGAAMPMARYALKCSFHQKEKKNLPVSAEHHKTKS